MTELLATMTVVEYENRRLELLGDGTPDWISVADDGGPFPDARLRGELRGRQRVRIPFDRITRIFKRTTMAVFEGEPVIVQGVREDGAVDVFYRENPRFAEEHGFTGGMREWGGWWGTVPRDAISQVTVTEHDRQLPGRPR